MDKYFSLVLDSMFLTQKITYLAYQQPGNERLIKLAGKAWKRNWRRVKAAKENGYPELWLPAEFNIK